MPPTKQRRTNRAARRKDAAQTRSARKHHASEIKHGKPPEQKPRGGLIGWFRSLFEGR